MLTFFVFVCCCCCCCCCCCYYWGGRTIPHFSGGSPDIIKGFLWSRLSKVHGFLYVPDKCCVIVICLSLTCINVVLLCFSLTVSKNIPWETFGWICRLYVCISSSSVSLTVYTRDFIVLVDETHRTNFGKCFSTEQCLSNHHVFISNLIGCPDACMWPQWNSPMGCWSN